MAASQYGSGAWIVGFGLLQIDKRNSFIENKKVKICCKALS